MSLQIPIREGVAPVGDYRDQLVIDYSSVGLVRCSPDGLRTWHVFWELGVSPDLQFGYACDYYDGFHKAVWLGPFSIYWTPVSGKERDWLWSPFHRRGRL